jgi:hypothetical protein
VLFGLTKEIWVTKLQKGILGVVDVVRFLVPIKEGEAA